MKRYRNAEIWDFELEMLTSLMHASKMHSSTTSTENSSLPTEQRTANKRTKRHGEMQPLPCSIIQICSTGHSSIFEGDVLTVYGPAKNKNPHSPSKVELLHADLIDSDGQMTITVNINNNMIKRFQDLFQPGISLRIIDFGVKNKTTYDRGDAKCSIVLHERTSIEKIPQVCNNRRLPPDTTIHSLAWSTDIYPVGSIAAAVFSCQRNNNQFELYIKDGDTVNDIAILELHDSYKAHFLQVHQQLASKTTPLYLYKNVVRQGEKGSQVLLRSSSATFIDTLNDAFTKARLLSFTKSNTQVAGTLKTKNVFAPPFRQYCLTCKQSMFQSSMHCTICKQKTECACEHSVDCILETDDGKTECTLRMPLLQQFCPAITEISFQDYIKSISATVYHLRTISIHGIFTLTVDNIITEIDPAQKTADKKKPCLSQET